MKTFIRKNQKMKINSKFEKIIMTKKILTIFR